MWETRIFSSVGKPSKRIFECDGGGGGGDWHYTVKLLLYILDR